MTSKNLIPLLRFSVVRIHITSPTELGGLIIQFYSFYVLCSTSKGYTAGEFCYQSWGVIVLRFKMQLFFFFTLNRGHEENTLREY